ncbi:monovalent cation/H(+) antiporter subunit G [Siminovitchia sp. FSL H7-0308]|uniref:Multicomponent Na+:H+ antiporter subunit G n=1 Tax=Siminovitchia thermophila TaxID=1245522 RepID=A0ABS2R2Z8_9BACI|nr:monovalent cation/H(+) antiporter subunit G [Siminovitchia thermophila]MBM7714008.1 multicomponent Na+:H+ antiporter subunit G [Siminovitchia thermophila]ONK23885.1 Na+/H+ antiporter subunit G [Bacillus sp. VT-16-64]
MNAIADTVIAFFILIGMFLSLAAAFGVIRLPDVYTRNHAASKSTTLGVLFTLLGVLMYFFFQDGIIHSRIMLGIAFIFITAPVAGHLISRAAYRTGVKMCDQTSQDDLKEAKD